ncbi:LysR family transcriptional regulator [Shewanella waksmanii]|uniref:LysR family transcriptional regulator n=1 Tax=Shewanella waksmanii TaxID=213783 RepID=UPI000491A462|nr:LysR substrate-binding domain-containing protein [Shewanella waksmanii]
MRITLKQLVIFKAIYTHGQISKAAKALHLSIPAVSMALKELEGSLGNRLFDRNANGLSINDNGKVILPYANDMLSKSLELEQIFSESTTGVRGSLKIGSSKTVGNYVLSRKIPLFKKAFPLVEMKLLIDNSLAIESLVSERELDIGFIDVKPTSKNLHTQRWFSDRICIVTSPENSIVNQPITAELLSEQLWVLDQTHSMSHMRAIQLLKSAHVSVNQELTMTSMGAIKRAIGTGIGVSILPWLAVEEEVERGDLSELVLPQWCHQRNYWIVTRDDDKQADLVRKFVEFCENEKPC